MLKATCAVIFTLATARNLVRAAAQLLAALKATPSLKRVRALSSSSFVWALAPSPAQRERATRPTPSALARRHGRGPRVLSRQIIGHAPHGCPFQFACGAHATMTL